MRPLCSSEGGVDLRNVKAEGTLARVGEKQWRARRLAPLLLALYPSGEISCSGKELEGPRPCVVCLN